MGDGGRSRGPFQISLAYWIDGGGRPGLYFKDVWDAAACREVILGYWRRYCPVALARADFQTLVRVHNGGPKGARKVSTLRHWLRVRSVLAQISSN